MKATISVTLKRDDGVVVSRTVEVEPPYYGRESKAKFSARAKRSAVAALNKVLGAAQESARVDKIIGKVID